MTLDSIKIAHSVFALPFALSAMVVAADGWPAWRTAGLIVLCMVAARSAAMAFNRLADRRLDAANPRTAARPTATGALGPGYLAVFVALSVLLFWSATWFLNRACFVWALPVMALLLGYSLSKRFTPLCHLWLGLCLGLAPPAAHLAVRGHLEPLPGLGERWGTGLEWFPLLLGAAVVCWTAGFDLIYACQDYDHDLRDPRVQSLPKSLGIARALALSSLLHLLAVGLLAGLGLYAGLGLGYYAVLLLVAALLAYEHRIVRPDDLSRVNVAFFTVNGAVSILLFAAILLERVILKGG